MALCRTNIGVTPTFTGTYRDYFLLTILKVPGTNVYQVNKHFAGLPDFNVHK